MRHKLKHKFRDATAPFRVLPDFLIIGAQKSGTSSLYSYLTQHPHVAAASGFIDSQKEARFFTRHFKQGTTWYRRHFPLSVHKRLFEMPHGRPLLSGESTPSYVYFPHSLRRIARTVPEAKLILLLRDPIERAFSHYRHATRLGVEHLTFPQAIRVEEERLRGEEEMLWEDENYTSFSFGYHSYLKRGLYAEQIERVFSYFPRDQVLILESADFFGNPQEAYDSVLAFLQLPAHQLEGYQKVNAAPRSEDMDSATRMKLQAYFHPHNEKLFRLLGRRFAWQEPASATEVYGATERTHALHVLQSQWFPRTSSLHGFE